MSGNAPGARIARAKRGRGLSQSVLPGLVGRSESWLSQVERVSGEWTATPCVRLEPDDGGSGRYSRGRPPVDVQPAWSGFCAVTAMAGRA